MRRERAKRFTADGIPRDARDWTEADWRDLHDGMEAVKEKIAARHARAEDRGGAGDVKPNAATKLPPVTEKAFMAQVVAMARLLGWRVYHPYDSRRSAAGFPDLVFLRGRWHFVAELKRAPGKGPTAEQRAWLEAFREAGVTAYLWTPADWKEIELVLREGPRSAA